MNLILDMDGTLVGEYGMPRPYLEKFLLYCFKNFSTVSIWTAAELRWYSYVWDETLRPILNTVSDELGYMCVFMHVLTRKDCVNFCGVYVKPLSKLWNSRNTIFTEKNTIMVDDKDYSFIQNVQQGILVREYVNGRDHQLLELIKYFDHLLSVFKQSGSIGTDEHLIMRNGQDTADFH